MTSTRLLRLLHMVSLVAISMAHGGRAGAVARWPEPLRVCADPNNMPFSNARREGIENRLAALLGHVLRRPVVYTWWAQRRGFFRNTLEAGLCDVVMGVPTGFDRVLTSAPYYRSSYVFVTRAEDGLDISAFDDPRLRHVRVGVQLVGDDGVNTPPAHALARRGIVDNVRGFSLFGDYTKESPPSAIIAAVAEGAIDVAIAWGPLGGYYAGRNHVALKVVPVTERDGDLATAFEIAVGVRRGDVALRDELDGVLRGHRAEVNRILDEFAVPRLP
jgi:mxaJ protein